MKNIIKIAGIEFTEEELKNAFFNKAQHFIVKYRRIYNLKYDLNSGFQALLVYEQNKEEKIPLLRKEDSYYQMQNFVII